MYFSLTRLRISSQFLLHESKDRIFYSVMNNDNLIWSRANVCYTRIEKDNLSKRPIMNVNVMPSHFLLTYIAEFYRFLHNSCAWFYNIDFLSRLLRLKVSYISFSFIIFSDMVHFIKKTIFLVSSSDFCDRNAFVENLAIRAKVKSRLQPFFGQTKRPMAWKHWFSVKSTKKMASSEK